MKNHPYRDPQLSVEARVDDLLSRLTLEEKAGQISQYFYFGSAGELPVDFDIESVAPEHLMFLQQPKLVQEAVASGLAGSVLFVSDPSLANTLQKLAVDGSRLGIPLLFGFDVIHGLRTVFPVPIGLAASWDTELIESVQSVAAREARAVGIHWSFAPMVDVARDPRWGRIIEGSGEDPYLGAAVAAAQVRGFQGDLGGESVLAGPKHLAGYGAALGGRDYDEVDLSDSELRNVYLPPFQAAIDAGAANIMSAYMDLNGVPASGNEWLLTEVLREEMGFDGFVVSDANAVKSLETQHFASSPTDAAARALNAGLDMEMCMLEPAFSHLPDAVRQGLVAEGDIDAAVRRVLTAKFRLGLFENPFTDADAAPSVLGADSHNELARTAAERSAVLLKNEGTLPLDAEASGSIAVIGQLAASRRDTLGPWVFAHETEETVSILDGVRNRVGADVSVVHADGAGIPARRHASMFDRQDPTVVNTATDYDDEGAIERAVSVAAAADVAIVVVGERQNQIGENASNSTLDLPGRQLEQLQRIVETGTPVVLLVMSGRPLDLQWAEEHVPAILEVWYPGSRGGDAVAALVFGDVSPAGRLPFSWPRHVGHVPMVYSHLRSFVPGDQDKRYWGEDSSPLYPFGHGLSYGSVQYGSLRLEREAIAVGESVAVTVEVTNDSDRAVDEIAQLYIHQRHGTASRPVRELKGFRRVSLAAGETAEIEFRLGPDELRFWSSTTRTWVQDATTFDIWVGPDSTADLAAVLTVTP